MSDTTPDVVWKGGEDLRQDLVALSECRPDPQNVMQHGEENVEAIAAALAQFGQVERIICNRTTGFIVWGHGRVTAAESLGWTHLAVRWGEWDAETARRLALAGNRTAQLAEYDNERLQAMLDELSLLDDDPLGDALQLDALALELDLLGTEEEETAAAAEEEEEEPSADPQMGTDLEYRVLVNCKGEEHQAKVLAKLARMNLDCEPLIS